MKPLDVLIELLRRMAACGGAPVHVTEEELKQWPEAAVSAMKAQKLLVKARPASSATCPGCERECVMPVHTSRTSTGKSGPFIVCEKRSDINRVAVPADSLICWLCSADAVCDFIADSLGVHRSGRHPDESGLWEIGIATGKKRRQMLCLKAEKELVLTTGTASVEMAVVVFYRDGQFLLDEALIGRLVDAATAADPRYIPTNVRREARKLDTQALHES